MVQAVSELHDAKGICVSIGWVICISVGKRTSFPA